MPRLRVVGRIQHDYMERCGLLAARCALSAKSVVPELILFGRRVPVDSHGAGGGRNWADPVTWHRDTGCCSKHVAHFRRGLHDPLWLCREHYVFVRISSKCRCAKCERENDTRASNRPTAQATKPVFYSHPVIVIPFRILGKLIQRAIQDKETILSILRINPGATRGGLSQRGHRLPAWVRRHLETELHGMTKQFDQLLAQDLPALNDSNPKANSRFRLRLLKSGRTVLRVPRLARQ